jgi:hypothetical protein
VQGIVFALFLAAFIAVSEPTAISIDSVQSLQAKKRVPLGVKTMLDDEFLPGRDCLSAWCNSHIMRLIVCPFHWSDIVVVEEPRTGELLRRRNSLTQ